MKQKTIMVILLILLAMPFALAQESDLPDPGITPDTPAWGIDVALDKINIALTFDKGKKIEKRLMVAEERLAEIKAMAEAKDVESISKAEAEREKQIDSAEKEARESGISATVKDKVLANLQKHIAVLQSVQAKLLEKGINQTMGVANAINKSSQVIVKFQNMNVTVKTDRAAQPKPMGGY